MVSYEHPMEASRLKPLVNRYLRERREGALEPQLMTVASQLDALYWEEVESRAVAEARGNPEHLSFDKDARLLIDLGLLDWELLEGGEKHRSELIRELYAPSTGGPLYFSEWLARRYRSFLLMNRVRLEQEHARSETEVFRRARSRLYAGLQPLFRNLPGFSPPAIDLFLSCRLDEAIDDLGRQIAVQEDERVAEQRKQLLEIRAGMLARARERARGEEDLALFDALAKLDRLLQEKVASLQAAPAAEARSAGPEERMEFVRAEIKLVRSLLRLGVAGSGLMRTHSVLVNPDSRLTKAQVSPIVATVKESDAGLPASLSFAVAPYVGTGFYEWDRDTLFVPLRSTRSKEDSVVTALANFRILLDSFQENGLLRRAYEERFGAQEFRESFVRDYKNWVLGVGLGFRGALEPAAYAFFHERIGPRSENLFALKEWSALTPDEWERAVAESRRRINRAEATLEDRYRLAVALVRENRRGEALTQLHEAVRLNPLAGRILFARAWLLAQTGARPQAHAAFAEVQDLCPNTIWFVYAADEMANL